jgi:hypothetical protein
MHITITAQQTVQAVVATATAQVLQMKEPFDI